MRSIKSFSYDNYKQTIKSDSAKKSETNPISRPLLLETLDEYPPIWRQAFALAENVRFTRTPDIEFLRKKAEKDPAYAEQLREIFERQQKRLAALTLEDKSTNITSDANKNDTATAAPIITSTAATKKLSVNETTKIKQPENEQMLANKINLMEAPAKVKMSQANIATDITSQKNAENRTIAKTSAISDFAFFEFGLFDITPELDTYEQHKNCPIDEKSQSQTSQSSITDLFRVLECKFSKSGRMEAVTDDNTVVKNIFAARKTHTTITVEKTHNNKVEPEILAASSKETIADTPFAAQATTTPAAPIANTIDKDANVALPNANDNNTDFDTVTDHHQEAVVHASHAHNNTPSKNVAITPRHVTDLQSGLRISKQIASHNYIFPSVELLQPPVYKDGAIISQETLERSAGLLESVLEDFGVKGEIIHVRPGPVVTLYEFEPAPGVKSSRVIGLADDIARSMSAVSARVAVIPGRNVIGIELPNIVRETVFLREIVQSKAFETSNFKLALALGKNIGGEPIIAELAKMPHLLVAGTTGSGKSVAINTMILSLLYHLTPNQCRLIMVDPKMLELSIYDGIPHLLTPVVTDPKKAVTALKWAVREMEDRYRKMAKLGVRNIDGFNERVSEALKNGETIMCTVQAGFDKETGELLYNEEAMDLSPLPYIVIIVDEMADLMMVAGKEIEGAIQRLAQMARAAGIHLIMATQRPSVDVITGTIKANFPTRISFQVTSKIDSRTILGEQGAETLLGQGDMLHMAGGGRIVRVHGAFVSDSEVEHIVAHLKTQGTPDYLATVTDSQEDEPEEDNDNIAELVANAGDDAEELYLQGLKIVMRDKKCSTSYIQRRLGIGYNKAATIVERMEKEGLVGPANHVGKREILINNQ